MFNKYVEEIGNLSIASLQKEVLDWLVYVENYYGVKPIIYSGHNFKKKNLSHPKLRDYPFWIAHYYKDELDYDGDWLFWQHTDLGDIKGIKGDVDLNIFNGSFNITEPKDPSTGIDNATNVFQWKQTSNTISIEGANVKSMRLISLTGSLIAQSSNNSIEITSLPTGTYIVIAQLSNGQTSNYKFAK